MLHYIKGKLMMKIPGGVVVDNGGIGFEINVPDNSKVYFAKEGDTVALYLYMSVREDDISLYGFSEKNGLDLFRLLITVNGVGAKAAMAVLSLAPAEDIARAIVFEDAAFLTKAGGIGKKTAMRIVLELKEKAGSIEGISYAEDGPAAAAAGAADSAEQSARSEALSALVALGYTHAEAAEAVESVKEHGLSGSDYIKKALGSLF